MDNSPQMPIKKKKSRQKRSLKGLNFDQLHKKLTTILERDIDHLLNISFAEKLNRDDSTSLVNYLKLFKILQKDEADNIANLTDADLEKLANK